MLRFSPRTRRSRSALAGLALILVLALILGAFACNDTTTTAVEPTTGILIRSEQLLAGRGCGVGATQIFKYAVVVFRYDGSGDPVDRAHYNQPYTSNVFDCYVDGEFVDLVGVGTDGTFRLEVYAYNADSYNAAANTIVAAGSKTSDLKNLTKPTYTTQCTATQSVNVEQLAQCDPLSAGLAGVGTLPDGGFQTTITLTTQSFHLPNGQLGVCVTGAEPVDAGADAEADADADATVDAGADADADADLDASADAEAGADAAADAAADAGAPDAALPAVVAFQKVRVRPRVGGNVVAAAVDIECPTTYIANVDAFPATYTVDVGLIDSAGNPIGQTACTVTTVTGQPNAAACP